ncbi:MAG: HEPN domain-containing protein [Gemmatimonadota bacterium]
MRKEIERSIRQAERDLENARKNVEIEAYELASFMCQQAVEKFLKAAWMLVEDEAPPRTHSLVELGDPLGVPDDRRRHLVYLNADYTTARYPDAANGVPFEIYDRETAVSKVEAAEELFEWLRALVEEAEGTTRG